MASEYKERLRKVIKQVKRIDSISQVVRDNLDFIANGDSEELLLLDAIERPEDVSQQKALFNVDESKIEPQLQNISGNDIDLIKNIQAQEDKQEGQRIKEEQTMAG